MDRILSVENTIGNAHRKEKLQVLPAYVRYILDNRLNEFLLLQWRQAEEIKAPIMKHFSGIPEEQLLAISIEPARSFWSSLIERGMHHQIGEWLKMWESNQIPYISPDQAVADDITKGSYVMKISLMHFLKEYTVDFDLYSEISTEIEYYLQGFTAATFNTYIDLQSKRLREGSVFSEALIDASTDIIMVFDRDLQLMSINKRASRHFSLTREEAIRKPFVKIFPKVAETPLMDGMKKALRGEAVHFENIKSFVSENIFEVYLTPLRDDMSEVYGILFIARATGSSEDNLKISDLNFAVDQKDEVIRRSEEQYQKMIAEVKDYAIILLDVDGTIRNWNMGAERIKGYSAEEIVGKNFRLFYGESDRENQLPEILLREASEQGRATHEGWRVRGDGTRFWGSIVITALHDQDGKITGFSKVTRDLTERKKAEEELRAKNELLEKRNEVLDRKNKELRAFNHVASHDLQEPLRKIRTFANLILDPPPKQKEDRQQELLKRIISSTESMQEFIEDLMKYSKAHDTSGQMEDIDLQDLFEGLKSEFTFSGAEPVNVSIHNEVLPHFWGIRFQLRELFQNLIGNSIKYRKADEDVVIDVTYRKLKGKLIPHDGVDLLKEYHFITFSDNGIGFAPEYSEKIFEPFQRLHSKSEFSGTGVGLAICKAIAVNHQGLIFAHGSPGGGATFYIALPAE